MADRIFQAPAIALLLIGGLSQALADEARDILFSEAIAARTAATEARGALLAPESFGDGEADYRRATEGYERGRSLERVRRSLNDATEAYRLATAVATRGQAEFAEALSARAAAIEAGADKLTSDSWADAERRFRLAAISLERADQKLALERGATALDLYRQTELEAIKKRLLTETRALIEQARRNRVQRSAPRTLEKAQRLLAEADTALEEDRYDTDRPRALARQANYEARHAIYLAQYLDSQRDQRATEEDLILAMEEPLRRIAAAAEIAAEFDKGPAEPAGRVIEYLQTQQDRVQNLEQDLDERTRQVFALEQEITGVYERLGGVSDQRQAMQRELERQEMERQRLLQVEALFERDEARVLRQGEDVILRLTGLRFPVGGADIPATGMDLMSRVQTALRLYPDAQITVTGHTDSFGSDAANFELSRRRAESVRTYLLTNLRIPAARVAAVGYGETRPVSSNETPEGRANNRRIDLIVRPAR